jgi:hypothetical protein
MIRIIILLDGSNNSTVKPISVLHGDGIVEAYVLEGDTEILGIIKADLFPYCAFIHPEMYKVNKTTMKKMVALLKEVTSSIKRNYGFTSVSAITNNHKMVNMITEGKAVVVMEEAGTCIYELEIA